MSYEVKKKLVKQLHLAMQVANPYLVGPIIGEKDHQTALDKLESIGMQLNLSRDTWLLMRTWAQNDVCCACTGLSTRISRGDIVWRSLFNTGRGFDYVHNYAPCISKVKIRLDDAVVSILVNLGRDDDEIAAISAARRLAGLEAAFDLLDAEVGE